MNQARPEFVDCIRYVARTDVGMRRANNQDSHKVILAEDESSWSQRGHLFIVADGMGAHAAGELASKIAVDSVAHLYYHDRENEPAEALQRAIIDANAEIHRRGLINPDFHGMGTTTSALVIRPEGACVGHVGDSRIYRLRGGRLQQLTFDHSLQWELRRNTKLSPNSEFAKTIPKNVITRSLGPNPSVVVDLEGTYPLEKGDKFLLCSDGLTGQVSDQEIAELLDALPLEDAARVLVDLGNLRGGPDNITLILVSVENEHSLADAKPVVATPQPRKRSAQNPISIVCLPLAVVGLLVAFVLFAAEQAVPAAVFGFGAIIAVIVAVIAWLRGQVPRTPNAGEQGKLGKGPYSEQLCNRGGAFVKTLSSTLDQLRQAATEEGWQISWSEVDQFRLAARNAAAGGGYPEAVRQYTGAISFMMDQLRQQKKR
jgi:protein phosphatase